MEQQYNTKTLMSSEEIAHTLANLATAVIERHGKCKKVAFVGIQRRGVDLARRLKDIVDKQTGSSLLFGSLDITLYRDDWTTYGAKPSVRETFIPFSVEDVTLILIDDVLFTGRTIKAALEALTDFGRPRKVELLILVDRGNRELPIHADYVGVTLETDRIKERVDVLLQERDGQEIVQLVTR